MHFLAENKYKFLIDSWIIKQWSTSWRAFIIKSKRKIIESPIIKNARIIAFILT